MKYWPGMNTDKTPMEEIFLQKNKKAIELRKNILPVERQISSQLWKGRDGESVEIISGKFTYDVIWVLLAMGKKVVDHKKELGLTIFQKDGEPIGMALYQEIADSDFQKILGKEKYSSDFWYRAVTKAEKILIDIQQKKKFKEIGPDGEIDHELIYGRHRPMILVDYLAHSRKKRGRGAKKNTERLYRVYFTSAFGNHFIENLWENAYSFMPKKLLAMPIPGQMLMFTICGISGEVLLSFNQVREIFGWKKTKNRRRVYQQKERINELLDKLKGNGFLKGWWLNKDRNVYHLIRLERYLELGQSN